MIRSIDGFHQDDDGDWVAELSCLHNQHVRHQPPFRDRSWVTTVQGRTSRIGEPLECPLCDRAELPGNLHVVRTAGPFDERTLPAGLRQQHRVAARTWGVLRVLDGVVQFKMATDPVFDRVVRAGDEQPIPPDIPHAVRLDGPARLVVDFLTDRRATPALRNETAR